MIKDINVSYFLVLASIMFFIGLYGFLVRRNLITILMSIELMLNAVNINFVAFNKFLYPEQMEGVFFSIFIVAIAAAEASVAIALVINIYRKIKDINVEKVSEMKG